MAYKIGDSIEITQRDYEILQKDPDKIMGYIYRKWSAEKYEPHDAKVTKCKDTYGRYRHYIEFMRNMIKDEIETWYGENGILTNNITIKAKCPDDENGKNYVLNSTI